MKIIWKIVYGFGNNIRYEMYEKAMVGKICVGACRKSLGTRYNYNCTLPDLIEAQVQGQRLTLDDAKRAVEKSVNFWFEQTK